MSKRTSTLFLSFCLLALAGLLWLAGGEFLRSIAGARPLAAGLFNRRWLLTNLELLLFGLWIVGGLATAAGWIAAQRSPAWRARLARWMVWRSHWPRLAWLLALVLTIYPAFFLLNTFWGDLFRGPYLRLLLFLCTTALVGVVLPLDPANLVSARSLGYAVIFAGGMFGLVAQAMTVNNHPFSLTWSEGNRLYEYSLPFISGRYQYAGELSGIRQSGGRYWLWGLPFLIPGAPIWVHRLWNALLATLPHLALGYLLARWSGLGRAGRGMFALWVYLFLAQGPIYTPLILCALLVVLPFRPSPPGPLSPKRRGGKNALPAPPSPQRGEGLGVRGLLLFAALAAVAGYYAAASRWTWLPAVPVWAAFLLLALRPAADETRPFWSQRNWLALWPAALVSLVGLAGGLLANPKLLMPQKLAQSTALSQPLLWYRLLPSATYPEGVLLALALAAGPLAGLLLWLAASRRWKLTAWQALAYPAALLLLLGGGLVASVKIGGGNNLHNLDMFLVSLAILTGLTLRGKDETHLSGWPWLARLALALALVLPAWGAVRSASLPKLPPQDSTRKALEAIRSQVSAAQQTGEVLFIDQRQLLTFGYLRDVPLVPEYEKKYMMDQAMSGDADYFAGFYRDLAAHRFALIVSDMQFTLQKDSNYAFGEENNAWVQWVAQPLLCYYTPLRTMQNVDIQLLVPKTEPVDCP